MIRSTSINPVNYNASFVFSLENDNKNQVAETGFWSNYWLAPNGAKGANQGFVISLGRRKTVVGIKLKNTHNAWDRDRSAKEFKILGSLNENGPWEELLHEHLEDSRQQDPPPLQHFMFARSVSAEFIQFQLLDYWGVGGGLQHLCIMSPTTTSSATTTTTPVGGDKLI